jgi:DNA-binding MurR/RpiR family transcriptional regulator
MHPVEKEFYDRVVKEYSGLSAKKKRVADFILQDYKKISLMTAKELALQCGVSEPTIIRFAVNIGFSGYLELTRHVKDMIQMRLSSVDRLLNAASESNKKSTLEKCCENAFLNFDTLMSSISPQELQTIAQTIYNAKKIYVVGYRASAIPASYFGYFLKKIHDNITVDTTLSWEINDSIARNTDKSIIFAIAFRRYSRRIIKFLEYARKCDAKIIGLTDNLISPIINLSDQYTVIELKGVSFVDPLAHVITYLGALIHEIAFIDTQKVIKSLETFEAHVKLQHEFFINDNDSRPAWMPLSEKLKDITSKEE